MKLTWLGHSCFLVESQGYRIVFDPYEPDSVPGYLPISVEADQVLCSHEHRDHHGVNQVTLRQGAAASPFTIRTISMEGTISQISFAIRTSISVAAP